MTADEWLTFYYPYFSNTLDKRFVTADIRAQALSKAAAKAPLCEAVPVGSEQQKEAIAHYAAYILDNRYTSNAAGSGVVAGMVLKREKEGDVEREWTAQTKLEEINSATGADTPYERYWEIFTLCPQVSRFKLRTLRI